MVYQKFYLNVKIKLILFFPDIPAPEYVLSYCVKKKKDTIILPFNNEELFVQSRRLEI